MRILIAEDDKRLLKSLVHIFKLNHYAVDGADNGTDAYSLAASGEYDGPVLDIMMPGMDGVALLRRLRSDGIATPALFLSARDKRGSCSNISDFSREAYKSGGFPLAFSPRMVYNSVLVCRSPLGWCLHAE